jgi:hypothetical protein
MVRRWPADSLKNPLAVTAFIRLNKLQTLRQLLLPSPEETVPNTIGNLKKYNRFYLQNTSIYHLEGVAAML